MESSKRVTSIFIAVALLALAALAFSVSRQQPASDEPDMSILPGLAENLRSMERLTGYPLKHVRAIRIIRTNGDAISLGRPDVRAAFRFETEPPSPTEKSAYSAILFANAAFLDTVATSTDFSVVTDVTPEQQLGQLTYTGFDGLTLENTVFRARGATWLKLTATYAQEQRDASGGRNADTLLSPEEVKELALGVQGRLYQQPDEPPQ